MSTTKVQPKSPRSADGAAAVPRGYKRTEVGVIPEDWTVSRLGTIAVIKGRIGWRGYTVNDLRESGPLVIGGTQISADHKLDLDKPVYISREKFDESPEIKIRQGDLLLVKTGNTIGKTALIDHDIGEACINPNTAIIRSHDCDSGFLYQVLIDRVLQKAIWDSVVVGAQPSVNQGKLKALPVILPSITEQRAIAEALLNVDGLIGALDKLIAKKRAIKQAAMQQLLTGKTRLPGFSGKWQTKTLGEVADIKNGATPSTQVAAYWNGAIPWCTPTDITGTAGKYLTTTERSITAEGLASCAASLLPAGALLLCSRATIGEIKIGASQVCTNQGFKSLVCKDGVSNEFLYYLLLTLKPQMIERATGTTFLEIGKSDVASIQVKLPQHNEQSAIATVLSDMDTEIAALERRRDKTKAIKQGMMQSLLTGRVRLMKGKS